MVETVERRLPRGRRRAHVEGAITRKEEVQKVLPKKEAKVYTSEDYPAPVVDVPESLDQEKEIQRFAAEIRPWMSKYVEIHFDGADTEILNALIQEVSECVILVRSPKDHEFWDTENVEAIIKAYEQESKKNSEPNTAEVVPESEICEDTTVAEVQRTSESEPEVESQKVESKLIGVPPDVLATIHLETDGKKQFKILLAYLVAMKELKIRNEDVRRFSTAFFKAYNKKVGLSPVAGKEKAYSGTVVRRLFKTFSLYVDRYFHAG